MIRFDHLTVTYDGAGEPVLRDVDIEIDEGELGLVVGPTGSGKTTLLRTVNGLVPHFSGGTVEGAVVVDGRSTAEHHPRDLADVVGFVVQDPRRGFVATSVEDELAFSMESLGIDPATMRRRVEEMLDLLGLEALRERSLETLSGGEAQRVAIGAALTPHPRVLVLDEPTSALDPGAAEDVLGAVHRLVHDLGVTVLMAEHRLERVVQFADRVLLLSPGTSGSRAEIGSPGPVLARSPLAPPVVRLARAAGWDPPPVTVRDARRHAGELRDRLADPSRPGLSARAAIADPVLRARGVVVAHGDTTAVAGVDLDLAAGDRVALMGRNGSGKSSLLWALQGTGERAGGAVAVGGDDPAGRTAGERRRLVGLVPQEPDDLLYHPTVGAELAQSDHDADAEPGTTRAILDRLVPGLPDDRHPRDLSEGQRLSLVLALTLASVPTQLHPGEGHGDQNHREPASVPTQLHPGEGHGDQNGGGAGPPVLLLDEPTRGLDQDAKHQLADVLAELADQGRAVVVATHDVEFAAGFATRVVVLAGGDVVTDGPADEVLAASPLFAPQVAKVLAPRRLLTVAEVEEQLRCR